MAIRVVNKFNKEELDYLFEFLNLGTYHIERKVLYYYINGVAINIKNINKKEDVQIQNNIMAKYLTHYSMICKFKEYIVKFEKLNNEVILELHQVANEHCTTAKELYLNILYLCNTIPEISESFDISKTTVRSIKTINRRNILKNIFEQKEQKC